MAPKSRAAPRLITVVTLPGSAIYSGTNFSYLFRNPASARDQLSDNSPINRQRQLVSVLHELLANS